MLDRASRLKVLFVERYRSKPTFHSFDRCYVDPGRYRFEIHHQHVCSFSEKYGLFFYTLPKCGSSTAKAMMKGLLDSGDPLRYTECKRIFQETLHNGKRIIKVYSFELV